MIIPVYDEVRWDSAFELLSLERAQPFFEKMGLPDSIVQEPEKLAALAKAFYKAQFEQTSEVDKKRPGGFARWSLETTFDKIAEAYTPETATDLYTWAVRYIVDKDQFSSLNFWSDLFRRNLDTGNRSELLAQLGLNSQSVIELNSILDQWKLLYPYNSASAYEELEVGVLGPPTTEWERWIKERKQDSVSEEYAKGVFDTPEVCWDKVAIIIRDRHTFLTWQTIKARLEPSEIEIFLKWGQAQAETRGISKYFSLVIP